MKKVLITGKGSYIGMSFETWVKDNEPFIETDVIDMKNDAWRQEDFSVYDVVFHVAGIAHADVGKVTDEQKALYYKVNTDLTEECAKKAKKQGVKQFIFMSSIIVYGESAEIGRECIITKDTPLAPANFYGDSKVKAEEKLLQLSDDKFKIVILRPPMIYGKGAKGNYSLLSKMAKKLPIFPNIINQRSMLYIGNLCKFVACVIEREEAGIFYPQNKEYVNTSEMVRCIANAKAKKIHLTSFLNPILKLMSIVGGKSGRLVNKAFGNMVYEKEMSQYDFEYQLYDLSLSISLTENE